MNILMESLKKVLKRRENVSSENKSNHSSFILTAIIGILEDVIFWKKMWLSIAFMFIINIILFVCIHRQINFLGFIIFLCAAVLCIDAIETWLKFKHRTICLKRLAEHSGNKLYLSGTHFTHWIEKRWMEFVYLREANHTKAFILVNIIFGFIFLLGNYINGYVLTYILCMLICVSNKVIHPLLRLFRNIQQDIESDCEYEGLIPKVSEVDIKLLSIEPEQKEIIDDNQSFDYWKPVDVPLEEGSDSSENSSSLVTHLSMEKMHTLEKEAETSDSSEDEYIPSEHKKLLQSTLEVVEPANTWSNSAYNAFWNLTGVVASMVKNDDSKNRRKRISSVDSSDGFEIVDKNDLK